MHEAAAKLIVDPSDGRMSIARLNPSAALRRLLKIDRASPSVLA